MSTSTPAMDMGRRDVTAIPALVVVIVFALVGPHLELALPSLLICLIPALISARMVLSRVAEGLFSVICFVAGAFGPQLLPASQALLGTGAIRVGWASLGVGFLALAMARLYIQRPWGGSGATLGFLILSLAVWGAKQSGFVYPTAIAAFIVTAAWALRESRAARPPLTTLNRRHGAALAVALAATLGTALTAALTLPPLQAWVVNRVSSYLPTRSGFSTHMRLGSMRGMLQSDRVVLRVRGEPVTHLRGVVYTRYHRGRWSRKTGTSQVHSLPLVPHQSSRATEVEHVGRTVAYFVPADANNIAVSTGFLTLAPGAILEPASGDPARRVWFEPSRRQSLQIEPPDDRDLAVPQNLIHPVRTLARAWTRGSKSPREQLALLEQRLIKQYEYSLEVERPRDIDPIIHFLYFDRRGHCEYFATALALLARSLGIPARVIGGYMVEEKNPLSDFHVVRQKNAHAWVEAHIDGRWQTRDATPAAERAASIDKETPFFGAITELLKAYWTRAYDWLVERTLIELLAALATMALLLLGVRLARLRRERASAGAGGNGDDPPLAGFLELEAALAARGLERAPSEPIEVFARRVDPEGPKRDSNIDPDLARAVRRSLESYATLRYGGSGDPELRNADAAQLAVELRDAGERASQPRTPV